MAGKQQRGDIEQSEQKPRTHQRPGTVGQPAPAGPARNRFRFDVAMRAAFDQGRHQRDEPEADQSRQNRRAGPEFAADVDRAQRRQRQPPRQVGGTHERTHDEEDQCHQHA